MQIITGYQGEDRHYLRPTGQYLAARREHLVRGKSSIGQLNRDIHMYGHPQNDMDTLSTTKNIFHTSTGAPLRIKLFT